MYERGRLFVALILIINSNIGRLEGKCVMSRVVHADSLGVGVTLGVNPHQHPHHISHTYFRSGTPHTYTNYTRFLVWMYFF
jgi:hypothetical protein